MLIERTSSTLASKEVTSTLTQVKVPGCGSKVELTPCLDTNSPFDLANPAGWCREVPCSLGSPTLRRVCSSWHSLSREVRHSNMVQSTGSVLRFP